MVLRPPFSGVENAVAAQAEALLHAESRYRRTVFWPGTLRQPPSPTAAAPNALLQCGPPWASRALRLLWEQCVLPLRLRALRANLLHSPAYVAPLSAPCPTVLSVYDLHALDNPERCRPLNRWNYRALLPASIHRAARIIVPSDHTAQAVARRFATSMDRVRVVPLGIHPRFHDNVDPLERRRLPHPLPVRYLLCVGNIEPRKNLPLAVEALDLLRKQGFTDLGLVVAGHATIGDPALDEAIRNRGLSGAVVCLGYVSDDLLPALYSGAEALVYPSTDEGFGLPPLEAMACGCPVLCSDAAALRQTTGGAALHFASDSPGELATAALPLLADPASRASLVHRALDHAARFRWSQLIGRVIAVYDEILLRQPLSDPPSRGYPGPANRSSRPTAHDTFRDVGEPVNDYGRRLRSTRRSSRSSTVIVARSREPI